LTTQGEAVEPFIALLVTVAVACVIGYRRGRGRTMDEADREGLAATYGEYLRAVSAAGLLQLSERTGDTLAAEEVDQARRGPQLVAEIAALLEGERADALIDGLGHAERPTADRFLQRIAADVKKYWPTQLGEVERVRKSLHS
jgi:hypothetical protein